MKAIANEHSKSDIKIAGKIKYAIVALIFFTTAIANAQVSVSVNIGTAPDWGPRVTTERYYYIPDIETYYDIRSREYIYINNGVWVRHAYLPVVYRNYDLYGARKVVIHDYRGNAPHVHYTTHKVKYAKGNKHGKHKGHGHGRGHGKH